MPNYRITTVDHTILDFDLNNRRIARYQLTERGEIANRLLTHISQRHHNETMADPEHSPLHPWMVMPNPDQPGRYIVLAARLRIRFQCC